MDPTAFLPSLTASPSVVVTARPPEAGAEDFAALLLRAGQSPVEMAAPGATLATAPGSTSAPGSPAMMSSPGLPAAAGIRPPSADHPLPPSAAGVPAPELSEPPAEAASDDAEATGLEAAAQPATPEIAAMMQAGLLTLPVPSPLPSATLAQATASAPASGTGTMPEKGILISTPPGAEALPAALPDEEPSDPAGLAAASATRLATAARPAPGTPAPASPTSPRPEPLAAQPALAEPTSPSVVPATPAPVLPTPPAASPGEPPPPMRDRPMAVAAAFGQAIAAEQGTNAAVMPEPPPMQERNTAAPALAPPAPHRPVELAGSSPEPPQPGPSGPVPSGPVPAPLAAAAADSAAPVATAAAPPPPARQVAQVTIALAMGHGRAPRLTVALEPEALGRVEIRIERGAEGEAASVQILAERPETLALLQRDARELDRTLAQAGVVLASGGMQFGLSGDQGGQPPEQRPQQQGGGGKGGDQAGRAPPAAAGPVQATLSTLSLLDIAV